MRRKKERKKEKGKKERKKNAASKKEPALLLHNLMICIYTLHQRKKERKFNDMHIYIALKKERKKKKKENGMCAQRRLRSAWESAQSDQSFRCPHEESLGPYLPTERTSKTMI